MAGEAPRSAGLRIGDTERESALQALGEHLSAGRLDLDEYGERSASVTAARTRKDLSDLFADLPAPYPQFGVDEVPLAGVPVSAHRTVAGPDEPLPARARGGTAVQRVAASVMGVGWIVGIVAAATTGIWWLIFFPVVLSAVCGSAWGKGWEHHVRREQVELREQQRWERRADRRRRYHD